MPDLTIEQLLILLAETPSRLTTLTADLSPEELQTRPTSAEWSANEVLAHLRSCADIWGNCIATILVEDRPTLRAINPTTWIKNTNYLELAFPLSLRSFVTQRAGLLTLLSSLPIAVWSRSATVIGAGKPFERTVLSYVQRLGSHERPHIKQIERIIRTLRI